MAFFSELCEAKAHVRALEEKLAEAVGSVALLEPALTEAADQISDLQRQMMKERLAYHDLKARAEQSERALREMRGPEPTSYIDGKPYGRRARDKQLKEQLARQAPAPPQEESTA